MILGIRNDALTTDPLVQLATNNKALSKSLERLSTGSKLARAADGPANLLLSEQLRAQLASLEQALENTELSLSVVQTADDALSEVGRILLGIRQTALAAANSAAYNPGAVAGLQGQIRTSLEAIDRVSQNTRFSGKNLLDGSFGGAGVTNDSELVFVKAGPNTVSSAVSGYAVDVSRLPRRAFFEAGLDDDDAAGLTLVLEEEDGNAITVRNGPNSNAEMFYSKLVQAVEDANMNLHVSFDGDDLTIEHQQHGLAKGFTLISSKDGVLTDDANVPELYYGADIAGTLNDEPASGNGVYLTGKSGNATTDGLQVAYLGDSTGSVGSVSVRQSALRFQIGTEAGDQLPVALANVHSSALGKGVPNRSGFTSLAEISLETPNSAMDAVRLVDEATDQLLSFRGYLGAVQKSLDHHDVVLRLAQENIGQAESVVRDADMAKELTEFTKRQIIAEANTALLAQSFRIRENALRVLLDVQHALIPVRHTYSLL